MPDSSTGWMNGDTTRDELAKSLMGGVISISNFEPTGPVLDEFFEATRLAIILIDAS
jgi:hypothetical protein